MTNEYAQYRIDSDLRRRAEKVDQRSAAQSPEDIDSLSAEEIRRRFHELRVHQIELEMQNVQLRQTQAALEVSQARYFDLYDLAPVGYFSIIKQGLLMEANLKASELLGLARGELVGQRFSRYIHAEDNDVYYLLRKQLFESCEPQSCDLRMVQSGGTVFWAHLSSTLAQDESGALVSLMMVSDITERKQAEEGLRESEQNLRTLADSGQALIWTAGTDKRCDYFNRVWLEFTGRTVEQESGDGWLECVHLDDRQHCLDIYFGAFNRREKFSMVYRLRRSDGEYRWLLDEGCPRYDSKGAFIGYIGHCLDITELKRAEEALRESKATIQKKLQVILQPEGDVGTLDLTDIIDIPALQNMMEHFNRITKLKFVIIDNQGKVLVDVGGQDICTKFHRMHPETSINCKKNGAALGRDIPAGTFKAYRCYNNLWDIATPIVIGDKHLGHVLLGQFFYEGESLDYELFRSQAQRYGFNEKEYLAALDRIPRWSQETVDATIAFYSSIATMISSLGYSTVKLARTLSQKDTALQQLDESKAFQSSLLEAMPIPVFYMDTNGLYLGCNRAFENFFGTTKNNLIGQGVFDIHPPELAKIYQAEDAELFRTPGQKIHELTIQGKLGTPPHNVIFHKASLIDSQGMIIGLIGAIIDITERKLAEEETKTLQAQLLQAQKMEAIGQLAAGIAHEINSPAQYVLNSVTFVRQAFEDLHDLLVEIGRLENWLLVIWCGFDV